MCAGCYPRCRERTIATAGDGSWASEQNEGTRTRTETRQRRATVAQRRTQTKEGEWGHSCLPFSRATLGYLLSPSCSDTLYATEREKGKGEESRSPKRESCRRRRAASCAKGVRCSDKMQRMYEMSERDSEREVERSGRSRGPMARENEGKLERGVTNLR